MDENFDSQEQDLSQQPEIKEEKQINPNKLLSPEIPQQNSIQSPDKSSAQMSPDKPYENEKLNQLKHQILEIFDQSPEKQYNINNNSIDMKNYQKHDNSNSKNPYSSFAAQIKQCDNLQDLAFKYNSLKYLTKNPQHPSMQKSKNKILFLKGIKSIDEQISSLQKLTHSHALKNQSDKSERVLQSGSKVRMELEMPDFHAIAGKISNLNQSGLMDHLNTNILGPSGAKMVESQIQNGNEIKETPQKQEDDEQEDGTTTAKENFDIGTAKSQELQQSTFLKNSNLGASMLNKSTKLQEFQFQDKKKSVKDIFHAKNQEQILDKMFSSSRDKNDVHTFFKMKQHQQDQKQILNEQYLYFPLSFKMTMDKSSSDVQQEQKHNTFLKNHRQQVTKQSNQTQKNKKSDMIFDTIWSGKQVGYDSFKAQNSGNDMLNAKLMKLNQTQKNRGLEDLVDKLTNKNDFMSQKGIKNTKIDLFERINKKDSIRMVSKSRERKTSLNTYMFQDILGKKSNNNISSSLLSDKNRKQSSFRNTIGNFGKN